MRNEVWGEKEIQAFINKKLSFSKEEQEKFWNTFTGSYTKLIGRGMSDFEAKTFIYSIFNDFKYPIK